MTFFTKKQSCDINNEKAPQDVELPENLASMNSKPSDISDIKEHLIEDKPRAKHDRITPGQTATKNMIAQKTKQILALKEDLAKCSNIETRKHIKRSINTVERELKQLNKKLSRQIYQANYQREKFRPGQKLKLERAGSMDKSLLPRSSPGRPRLSEHQLGLLEAIISVATADKNKVIADPQRRS